MLNSAAQLKFNCLKHKPATLPPTKSPDKGIAEMIVVKQRNGPTGTVKLLFDTQYIKFKNLVRRD
ncbi:DnaB-like helicase C-terminal domain-containing protein (plasmid) [Nostoc sp. UHCC 0302]|uniref:DnaB-like helicase C-terminal domain-containing protein n=1 Tax=Nostoc sp. UHCC 0302 TaxID=3134896 RepID=UPI00311CDC0B